MQRKIELDIPEKDTKRTTRRMSVNTLRTNLGKAVEVLCV